MMTYDEDARQCMTKESDGNDVNKNAMHDTKHDDNS